jgi:hypothetical protein
MCFCQTILEILLFIFGLFLWGSSLFKTIKIQICFLLFFTRKCKAFDDFTQKKTAPKPGRKSSFNSGISIWLLGPLRLKHLIAYFSDRAQYLLSGYKANVSRLYGIIFICNMYLTHYPHLHILTGAILTNPRKRHPYP